MKSGAPAICRGSGVKEMPHRAAYASRPCGAIFRLLGVPLIQLRGNGLFNGIVYPLAPRSNLIPKFLGEGDDLGAALFDDVNALGDAGV